MDNIKKKRLCKWCGKEFVPCHKTSIFCSKSCATSYRNDSKLKDGTHSFYKIDRSSIAKLRVKNGTHPFLKGNMSEKDLEKKAKGIKNARLKEAKLGIHTWQNPKNFIKNEYSRSINSARSRKLNNIYLYIADTDFSDTFKIGWTNDLKIRELDTRTQKLHNLKEIISGTIDEIITLEKDIKLKFFNQDYYNLYHSTEIFPNTIKNDILKFINLNNPQRLS